MPIAITREVSRSITDCQLTHLAREPIDLERARMQHAAYGAALRELGCTVVELPELPEYPDAVFVEDTAVVLPELAIITRPGAPSRRAEVDSVATVLAQHRTCVALTEPATLDGGDVLVLGKRMFVGLSSRSNTAAVHQLQTILGPYGYDVAGVELNDCLHLKSAATQVGPATVLLNPAWIDRNVFADYTMIEVDAGEPFAANGALIGNTLLYPTAFPHTQARLAQTGIALKLIDVSEFAKAEGAVTCCSILIGV